METVRRHTPGLTELAVRLGERAVERLNEQIAKEAAVTFVPERPAHAPAVV